MVRRGRSKSQRGCRSRKEVGTSSCGLRFETDKEKSSVSSLKGKSLNWSKLWGVYSLLSDQWQSSMMYVNYVWIVVNPCSDVKSNTQPYSWGGVFRAGILLSVLWRGWYQTYIKWRRISRNRGTNYTFVLFLLSKMEAPFCTWSPSSLQVIPKEKKQCDFQIPSKEISVSKGAEDDRVRVHAWNVFAALNSSSWVSEGAWWR